MDILTTPEMMDERAIRWKQEGLRIGFVPTMGFLHSGHISLMKQLRPQVDRLVVSIYVNPLQFGPQEDFSRYPRDPEQDTEKCKSAGVDALFMPEDLYPNGFSTSIHVDRLTDHLCGPLRPGHFEGVATVCARLFGLIKADVAIFGEKDYQQLQVIRRMVRDLAFPIEIVGGKLIRDNDGLALSSRNVYLSKEERRRALSIPNALSSSLSKIKLGELVTPILDNVRAALDVDHIDYLEAVDTEELTPLTVFDRPARLVIAAFVGRTRLLDNLAVPL